MTIYAKTTQHVYRITNRKPLFNGLLLLQDISSYYTSSTQISVSYAGPHHQTTKQNLDIPLLFAERPVSRRVSCSDSFFELFLECGAFFASEITYFGKFYRTKIGKT